jgi:hypothetical protein
MAKNGKKWQKLGSFLGDKNVRFSEVPWVTFWGVDLQKNKFFIFFHTNFSRKIQFLVKNGKKGQKSGFLERITHKIVENVFFRHELS